MAKRRRDMPGYPLLPFPELIDISALSSLPLANKRLLPKSPGIPA